MLNKWVRVICCAVISGILALPAIAQEASGVTKDEVKLGSWTPLSGTFAIYGVPGAAGHNAYFKMLNERGGIKGRKINLIIEDSAYAPQQSVAAARKLVDSDHVLAIIGGFGSGPSAATFPYLEQQGVPYVMAYGGEPSWYAPTRPLVIGAQVLYAVQTRVLGRWAAKDGARNVLIIHSAVKTYEDTAKGTEPGVKSVAPDAKIEFMPVKLGTTDYAPIALEVRNKAPDAVVFVGTLTELVALAKEIKQQKIKTQLYSFAGAVSKDTVRLGGDVVEGLRAVSYSLPVDSDAPAMKEYRAALAKYEPKEVPDYGSALTFALAKITAEAIRTAGEPLTRQSLMESFHKMKDFQTGIIGKVSFAPDQHMGTTSVQRVEVKGGRWVTVGDFVDAAANW